MRRFSQRNSLVTLSDINITPLLDLAFVLLIIFVITTPILTQSIALNLPQGGRPSTPMEKKDIRSVEINRQGNLWLDRRPMSLDQMEAELVRAYRANPNTIVYISADENGMNKYLYAVIDRCQRNGLTEFLLAYRIAKKSEMNRLHKKCLIASAALHSLLLVILLVGPAFLAEKSVPIDMPVLDVIPSKLVDELMSGGGNPKAQPPPPAPPVVTPPPAAKPTPAPTQPEKYVKPDPPQKEPIQTVKPEPIPDDKPKRKPLPQVSTKLIDRSETDPKAKEQAKAQAQANARADAAKRAAEFNTALRSLKEGLSSSTKVEVPGPGGEAYANYSQAVISVYQNAWIKPDDVRQEVTIVQATVTIARDGTVLSARITKSSGNSSVDKSVQRTLDRVKFVAPFPDGAKEPQRNFDLEFNLKSKQLPG